MSDNIDCSIDYFCEFNMKNVSTVIDAILVAIAENWVLHDGLEDSAPPRPAKLESWLADLVPEKMHRVPEELTEEEIELSSESLSFRFSPATTWGADLSVHKNRNGSLGIELALGSLVQYYEPDPNIGHDAQEKWGTNKKYFQNIINKLVAVFPVREARIAPEIAE